MTIGLGLCADIPITPVLRKMKNYEFASHSAYNIADMNQGNGYLCKGYFCFRCDFPVLVELMLYAAYNMEIFTC